VERRGYSAMTAAASGVNASSWYVRPTSSS
jgi:hypothetical protein